MEYPYTVAPNYAQPSYTDEPVDLCGSEKLHIDHVPSLSIKVINPNKRSDMKLFILRNVKVQYLTHFDLFCVLS